MEKLADQPVSSMLQMKSDNALVTRAIKLIFSAYRKDDYADAKGFVSQLGTILQTYPPSVVDHISSPHTGIQRRSKWPPNIAEIVDACNDRLGYEVALRKMHTDKIIKKKQEEKFVEPTPVEKARVSAGFDELLANIRASNVVEPANGRRRR